MGKVELLCTLSKKDCDDAVFGSEQEDGREECLGNPAGTFTGK